MNALILLISQLYHLSDYKASFDVIHLTYIFWFCLVLFYSHPRYFYFGAFFFSLFRQEHQEWKEKIRKCFWCSPQFSFSYATTLLHGRFNAKTWTALSWLHDLSCVKKRSLLLIHRYSWQVTWAPRYFIFFTSSTRLDAEDGNTCSLIY